MPRLSKEDRERAIGMLQVGQPKHQVAQCFGCTVRSIHRLWNRFNQTGSTSDHPRSGRPRVITPRGGPSYTAPSSKGQVSLRHGHHKNLSWPPYKCPNRVQSIKIQSFAHMMALYRSRFDAMSLRESP